MTVANRPTATPKAPWVAMLVAAAMGLSACSSMGGTANAEDSGISGAQTGLERVPLTITHGQTIHNFVVEVAATEQQQARGMMFRTSMEPMSGMIFPLGQPRFASFWMRNTLIPLDMLFIRADGSIDRIAENTVPESDEPVGSGGEVIAVLELAGGTSARLGITESAIVRWQGDRINRR